MRLSLATLSLFSLVVSALHATDLPTLKTALPDLNTSDAPIAAIDLRNHFEIADIHGQVVQLRTTLGSFNLEMLPAAAPLSVTNFLSYVNAARYATTFIHRSDKGLGVIQGGGYYIAAPSPLDVQRIATDPPIALEYNLPNTRGTIAMARTSDLNSATSEWFINTDDNSADLGASNGGGYAVFGRVTGTGMSVVDAIAALQVYQFQSPYGQLPLVGYTSGNPVTPSNLVVMNSTESIPLFPATAGQNAVVTFTVTSSNPALLAAAVSGSSLSLTPTVGQSGFSDVVVTATDTNGNTVQDTFRVNVAAVPPEIAVEQPAGTDLADGAGQPFGTVNVGSTASLNFTIKNTGSGALTLSGSPKVAIDGPDAAAFTVTAQPASPIAAGGNSTFTVRFAPASSGAKTATLHIANNDPDEAPFDIALTGTGNARPVLAIPASPLVTQPTSLAGAVVSFSATASDVEDGPLTAIVTPASGSLFPLGDTTVNVSATDANGAATTGSFIVRVVFGRPESTTFVAGPHTGDAAPGAGTGALPAGTTLGTFGTPAISNFRALAARVAMRSGVRSIPGIYLEDSAGQKSLVAYQGSAAPGITSAGVTFRAFQDPLISPNGSIAFLASLQGKTLRTTEDTGVWTDAFGPGLALLLREGQNVPGLPAGSRLLSVTSLSLHDGELLALITLAPAKGIVTTANDSVLLRFTSATAATVLLREGRELAGVPGSRISSFRVLSPAVGSAGHGRWQADGMAVAKVTLYDGRTMIVKISATGIATPLLSTTDLASSVNPLARWLTFGLPGVSSEGTGFTTAATLRQLQGGVTAANDSTLLFSPTGAPWQVLAREGSPAPVTPAGPLYAALLDPVSNDNGKVAFIASLQGRGITTTNRIALFTGTPENLTAIARTGAHPPDETGAPTSAVWSTLSTVALPDGLDAGAIFLGETTGGDTTAANKLGLWAIDSHGTLRRILRTGATLAPGGSPLRAITLLTAIPGSYGTTRSYNSSGSIGILATHLDGTQSLLRVDVP